MRAETTDRNHSTGNTQAGWEAYQREFVGHSGGATLEVAMVWADQLVAIASFPRAKSVTIGPASDNDFVVVDSAFDGHRSFPVVVERDGSYWATFTPKMHGVVRHEDRSYTLGEAIDAGLASACTNVSGAFEIELSSASSLRLDIADTTFFAHFTDLPAAVGASVAVDTKALPYLAGSAAAHLMVWLLAMGLPADAQSLTLDRVDQRDRFVTIGLQPDRDDSDPNDLFDDSTDARPQKPAANSKGSEGKAGKPDAADDDKRMAIEGPPDTQNPELKKARDANIAAHAGIAAAFQTDQVSSMWSKNNASIGRDSLDALGHLQGADRGNAKGFGGLGLVDGGRGGGNDTKGSIGSDPIATSTNIPQGTDDPSNLGEIDPDQPPPISGHIDETTGSLDREIIARVIRKHRREVAYCYQKQLQKDKSLAGRVDVKFTISGTGDVIASLVRKSTLKNGLVESCVTAKIRRWVFPNPHGGGIVVVNYGFNFSRQ